MTNFVEFGNVMANLAVRHPAVPQNYVL